MESSARARRESSAPDPQAALLAGPGSRKRPWFERLFGRFRPKQPAPQIVAVSSANALLAFPSEAGPRPEVAPIADVPTAPASASRYPARPRLGRPQLVALAALGVLFLVVVAVFVIRRFPLPQFAAETPRAGTLTIDTRAVSSEVLIDGERRGLTPLKLSITPGPHIIIVRSNGDERVVPLTIAAGADVTQYFEMKASQPVPLFGRLSVATDPPGARVTVDGRPRGTSPVMLADLTAEEHKIAVTGAAGSAERTVMVTAGGDTPVVFSLLSKVSGPVGGWISISSPFDVEVMENTDVLGTSGTSRIMLAEGHHSVVLLNRTLGYQEARKIDVAPGKTTVIKIEAPKASISVNARPWAEVLLDGNNVGQTPIANLLVTVGPHEIVFRNPQLPERKQAIVVTAKGPNRIGADLTK